MRSKLWLITGCVFAVLTLALAGLWVRGTSVMDHGFYESWDGRNIHDLSISHRGGRIILKRSVGAVILQPSPGWHHWSMPMEQAVADNWMAQVDRESRGVYAFGFGVLHRRIPIEDSWMIIMPTWFLTVVSATVFALCIQRWRRLRWLYAGQGFPVVNAGGDGPTAADY